MEKRRFYWMGVLAMVLAPVAGALVITWPRGQWPLDWPAALEPLRDRSRTITIASGIQENIYEIPFTDREEFEKLWPVILGLKTTGAPLTMYSLQTAPRSIGESAAAPVAVPRPMVRVRAPARANSRTGEFQPPPTTQPGAVAAWPRELMSPKGELPEYVAITVDNGETVITDADASIGFRGFRYRARTEIEIIVDGKVIDLNRIPLPTDTPVIDKRFPPSAN